ncbi:MAG: MarR family winged helix-turn-helix transcriptional regulator [Burkholderiaceae bacterium]
MKSKLAPHTEPTVLAFLETAYNLERRLDSALSYRGTSFSEYRLLNALARHGPSGSAKVDLAREVGLTPSAVTRALKPLEKLGYLTTRKNERDARQSIALITAEGQTLLSDAQGFLHELLLTLPLNKLPQQQVTDFQERLQDLR